MSNSADPSVLYHYCSNEAALEILRSRTIRMSALSLSNDSSEGRYLLSVAKTMTAEHPKQTEILGQIEWLTDLFTAVGFCLSEHDDSLSQWGRYSQSGSGVCIGFKRSFLEGNPFIDFAKVVYDVKAQENMLRHVLDELIAIWMNIPIGNFFEQAHLDSYSEHYGRSIQTTLKLAPLLYKIKHPFFREEDEWRLYSVLQGVKPSIGRLKLHFFAKHDKIVPFSDLQLDDDAISVIILGPKQINRPQEFASFLKLLNWPNVEVRQSIGLVFR